MEFSIPAQVLALMERLEDRGFEAWVVGARAGTAAVMAGAKVRKSSARAAGKNPQSSAKIRSRANPSRVGARAVMAAKVCGSGVR